ncbi:hypothetical protein B484DRAFT_436230, partial [Ochromonadaceae sp. CCMP2298]
MEDSAGAEIRETEAPRTPQTAVRKLGLRNRDVAWIRVRLKEKYGSEIGRSIQLGEAEAEEVRNEFLIDHHDRRCTVLEVQRIFAGWALRRGKLAVAPQARLEEEGDASGQMEIERADSGMHMERERAVRVAEEQDVIEGAFVDTEDKIGRRAALFSEMSDLGSTASPQEVQELAGAVAAGIADVKIAARGFMERKGWADDKTRRRNLRKRIHNCLREKRRADETVAADAAAASTQPHFPLRAGDETEPSRTGEEMEQGRGARGAFDKGGANVRRFYAKQAVPQRGGWKEVGEGHTFGDSEAVMCGMRERVLDLKAGEVCLDICATDHSRVGRLLVTLAGEGTESTAGLLVANLEKTDRALSLFNERRWAGALGHLVVTTHKAQNFPFVHDLGATVVDFVSGAKLEAAAAKGDEKGAKKQYEDSKCVASKAELSRASRRAVEAAAAEVYAKINPSLVGAYLTLRRPFFDRVLCHVPCSGDGAMRRTFCPDGRGDSSGSSWGPLKSVHMQHVQVIILLRALQLIKVGGRVDYWTNSLSPYENEAVVAAVLRCAGDSFALVDFAAGDTEDWGTSPGMEHWEVLVDDVAELRRDRKKDRKLSAQQLSEREKVGERKVKEDQRIRQARWRVERKARSKGREWRRTPQAPQTHEPERCRRIMLSHNGRRGVTHSGGFIAVIERVGEKLWSAGGLKLEVDRGLSTADGRAHREQAAKTEKARLSAEAAVVAQAALDAAQLPGSDARSKQGETQTAEKGRQRGFERARVAGIIRSGKSRAKKTAHSASNWRRVHEVVPIGAHGQKTRKQDEKLDHLDAWVPPM